MMLPIYKSGTVVYGDDGEYRLMSCQGNIISYFFTPYDNNKSVQFFEDTINDLSERLHVKILWAVYDDIIPVK